MKLDAFMPFYGSEFFNAVAGLSNEVIGIYVRCLWAYWSQTKCAGLRDDDDYLRALCHCERGQWPSVRAQVFGPYFTLEDGLWHQKRARKEFERAKELRDKRQHQTLAATEARLGKRYVIRNE